MQTETEKKQIVDKVVYVSDDVIKIYQNMTKHNKTKLLKYLTKRYDWPTSTISAKLRGKLNFTTMELEAVSNIINNQELWNN